MTALICLSTACRPGYYHQPPSEIGQGLAPADSLRAVLVWLSKQKTYEAETLRFQYALKLIELLDAQNSDTLSDLAKAIEKWASQSRYPIAKGISALARVKVLRIHAQYDSAHTKALAALQVFKGQERLDYIAKTYQLIGELYFDQDLYDEALSSYETAIQFHERIHDESGLAQCYYYIGNLYEAKGQHPEALALHEKAVKISEKIDNIRALALSLNSIGIIYQSQGYYVEALTYYEKALALFERAGSLSGLATCYVNIGNIHIEQARYTEALLLYQKVIDIFDRTGNQSGLATCYTNIGSIYIRQRQFADALRYHQKALEIFERMNSQYGVAICYNNIAFIYMSQSNYKHALTLYEKAMTFHEQIGDRQGVANCYVNFANIYAQKGDYDKALISYQKGLEIQKLIHDQGGLAHSYHGIGDLYRLRGLYQEGHTYLQEALRLAQCLGLKDLIKDIYSSLALTDSALAVSGRPSYWKSAYEYKRLYITYRDSILSEESIRKQAQLESQYEYDKKTALLKAEQEKERAIAKAEISRKEMQRNLSLIILSIMIIALGGLVYFFSIIRHKNRQLKEVNKALAESNRIIQAQAEEVKQKNIELELFNAELDATNKALTESSSIIQKQAEALIEKNEEILDSIRYAERIQRAILPSEEKWHRLLPDSFLIYQPKDIVAGDFYWLEETDRYIFLGVADATGHGVPGAFVSIVCAGALNRAVQQEGLTSPASILLRTKALVSEFLAQENDRLRDGMDIALVRLEKRSRGKLAYAGANRPLWIFTGGEVIELRPTRQAVSYTEIDIAFDEVEIDLNAQMPAMVYAFTDGIVDQMGGPKGRKLLSKRLREVLSDITNLPCPDQAEKLRTFFTQWKGQHQQVDDVTLIGVRLS